MWRVILIALVLFGRAVFADVVVVGEGETITGKALRVTGGALVFRSELSGQVMVLMEAVAGLSTEDNMVITMKDGNAYYGRFKSGEGGNVVVPLDGGEPVSIALAEVDTAMPLPDTKTAEAPGVPRLQANVEVGGRANAGARDSVAPSLKLEMRGESAGSQFDASAQVAGDDTSFPGQASARVEVSGNNDGIRPFAEAELYRNLDAAIDLRAELTLGLQKMLFENEERSFLASAGIGGLYEEWDGSDIPHRRRGADASANAAEIQVPLRLRYAQAIFGDGELRQEFMLIPSLSTRDLRGRANTALTFPLATKLMLRLNMELGYDSDPELDGIDKWNTTFGAGLLWNFPLRKQ